MPLPTALPPVCCSAAAIACAMVILALAMIAASLVPRSLAKAGAAAPSMPAATTPAVARVRSLVRVMGSPLDVRSAKRAFVDGEENAPAPITGLRPRLYDLPMLGGGRGQRYPARRAIRHD